MYTPEVRAELHQAVEDTAAAFHIDAVTLGGEEISVPCTYQIAEEGFRPFEKGKPKPYALQEAYEALTEQARQKGHQLGIEGRDSLVKLMLQMGWGSDCSNFAFHTGELGHDRLDLKPYDQTVFRPTSEIQKLFANGDLKPRGNQEDARDILLGAEDLLSIAAISKIFANDTWFIASSGDMASDAATVPVKPDEIAPCDLVVFDAPAGEKVEHIGIVVETQPVRDGIEVDFWHSWHSRGLYIPGGLRRDTVELLENGTNRWHEPIIQNPGRYKRKIRFRRPKELAKLAE